MQKKENFVDRCNWALSVEKVMQHHISGKLIKVLLCLGYSSI